MKEIKEMYRYVQYDRKDFLLTFIFQTLNSISNVMIPIVTAEAVTNIGKGNINSVYHCIIGVIVLVSLSLLGMFFSNHFNIIYLERTGIAIKKELSQKIMAQSYSSFMSKDSSEYLSMLVNDTRMVVDRYCDTIFTYIRNIISLIGAVIAIMYYNVPLAILSVLFGIYCVWFAKKFNAMISEKGVEVSKAEEVQTKNVKEVMEGYTIFKVYDCIALALSKLAKGFTAREASNFEYMDYYLRVAFYLSVNSAIGKHALWIISIILVLMGKSDIGLVIVIPTYAQDVMYGVRYVLDNRNMMIGTEGVRKKLDAFLAESEITEEIPTFSNTIELKHISYSYDNQNNIINDYSHTFVFGGKYALVGESGCGKSTLMKLMLGFLTPDEGQILVDGNDINNFNGQSWLKQLSYINQETFVFSDSIKNNIILDKEYDEELFKKVLNDSELSEWVSSLAEGENTVLSENGKNVSGGQKQRISIARALYHDKKLLFIDEATSALNEEMSYNIEKRLLADTSKTIFMITHHLNSSLEQYFNEIQRLEKEQLSN